MRMARPPRRNLRPYQTQVFSEAVSLGVLPADINATGNGSVISFKISDIPQWAFYTQLYSQYKFLGVKLTLLPRLAGNDATTIGEGTTEKWYKSRLVYAIQDQPEISTPGSEQAVLQMNGCKIRSGNSTVQVYLKPKAILGQTDLIAGTNVATSLRSNPFISFDNHGEDVIHAGLAYWVTQPGISVSTSVAMYDIYAKYHFVCRDPR